MGSRVNVVEIIDRRARIDQPVTGWCSIKSSNGDTILNALDETDQNTATPLGRSEIQSRVDNQKEKMMEALAQLPQGMQSEQKKLEELKAQLAEVNKNRDVNASDVDLTETLGKLKTEIDEHKSQIESMKDGMAPDIQEKVDVYMESQASLQRETDKLLQAQKLAEAAKAELESTQRALRNFEWGGDNEDEELPAFRPGDVVMLKENKGMGIVRYFGEHEGAEQIGLEYNTDMGNCNGEPHFKTEKDNFAEYVDVDMVKKSLSAEMLVRQLNKSLMTLVRMKTSKE